MIHSGLKIDSDGIVRPSDDFHGIEHDGLVSDLDVAIEFCKSREVAVQAGGCFGVWPLYLSRFFQRVYTFEPDWNNFKCLTINVAEVGGGASNVIPIRAALAETNGVAGMQRSQRENSGSGYLIEGSSFPKIRLDALELTACDLLCLDVEGSELDALKGAAVTIQQQRPVVMLEAKPMDHMDQSRHAVIEWLQARGYEFRRKIHKDYILTPRSK